MKIRRAASLTLLGFLALASLHAESPASLALNTPITEGAEKRFVPIPRRSP